MERIGISRAAMGRLPEYFGYVKSLPKERQYVSATMISKALELGEVQVRKDLSDICGAGRPKTGYKRTDLLESMEKALGVRNPCEAVIVGAGKLGTALLGFSGFSDYGIEIKKAFDIGCDGKNPDVMPMDALTSYCNLHQVEIGIIAVPAESAQSVCDLLIKNGICAIWCFSTEKLQVPENVTVQYENLALSLAHLHQKVKNTH